MGLVVFGFETYSLRPNMPRGGGVRGREGQYQQHDARVNVGGCLAILGTKAIT